MVFIYEDHRTLTENAQIIRYEFFGVTHENIAFYRYADSSAFLFTKVNEIALEGEQLTSANAEEKLSDFFAKLVNNELPSEDYLSLTGGTVTGDILAHGVVNLGSQSEAFATTYTVGIATEVISPKGGDGIKIITNGTPFTLEGKQIATIDQIPDTNGFVINGSNSGNVNILTNQAVKFESRTFTFGHYTGGTLTHGFTLNGVSINIGNEVREGSVFIGSVSSRIHIQGNHIFFANLPQADTTSESTEWDFIVRDGKDRFNRFTYLTQAQLKEAILDESYLPLTGGTLTGPLKIDNLSTTHSLELTFDNSIGSDEMQLVSSSSLLINMNQYLHLSGGTGSVILDNDTFTYNGTQVATVEDLKIKRISAIGRSTFTIPEGSQILSVNYNQQTLFSYMYTVQGSILSVIAPEIVDKLKATDRIEITFL